MLDKVRARLGYLDEMRVVWMCPECGTSHGVQSVSDQRIETRTQCFNCYHPFKVTFDGLADDDDSENYDYEAIREILGQIDPKKIRELRDSFKTNFNDTDSN